MSASGITQRRGPKLSSLLRTVEASASPLHQEYGERRYQVRLCRRSSSSVVEKAAMFSDGKRKEKVGGGRRDVTGRLITNWVPKGTYERGSNKLLKRRKWRRGAYRDFLKLQNRFGQGIRRGKEVRTKYT